MNPIENVWDHSERQIQGEKFSSKEALRERVQDVWKSIPLDYLRKLVDSMPRRVAELMKNKGGNTSY